jgi:hypothetical protein
MKRYLLLMYNKEMRMPAKVTKEMAEAGIKPWRDYLTPLMKKGLVESVAPVQWKGKMLTSRGTKSYNPRAIDLGGYMVIKAKNMADAIKIAKKSPHAKTRMGPTTVREIVEIEM